MVFEDIFSKGHSNSHNKPIVIVDIHEKNSLVVSELASLGAIVNFENLSVGDYIAGSVVIERKTAADLVSSMISKRTFSQLSNLCKYDKKLLIIEGSFDGLFSKNVHPNSIRGFLLSITLDLQIPIISTRDYSETAKFLLILCKKNSKGNNSLRHSRNSMSIIKRMEFVLQGFPLVGPSTSVKLLREFGSIKNIINSDEDRLRLILGKKYDGFSDLINRDYNLG